MKQFWLGIVFTLFISTFPAFSASAITPGGKCPTQGIKKISNGKSFTCIKSGKKLIWNKGAVVTKLPKAAISSPAIPTPQPTPPAGNDTKQNVAPEQIRAYENMKKSMVPTTVGELFRFHYSPNSAQSFKESLEL